MKRLVLVFGILASVVSVSMAIGNMTNNDIGEWIMNANSCINEEDKNACKVVFDKIQKDYGTQYCSDSVKFCSLVALIYYTTGDFLMQISIMKSFVIS